MRQSSTKAFGGPANINGVLYQVLRTLKKVASYSLSETTTQPLLIAEPIGGDLQVQTPTVREVSQFKTKAKHGTWSLASVIDEVLPDLYLAVDTSAARPSRYLFVTDGRLGTWAKALELFRDLRQRKSEEGHELDALDDIQKVKFSREYTATERELFLRVVKSVRSRTKARKERRATTITNVWHLLDNFDLKALQTKENADAEITRLLRELGVAPNHVAVRRAALIGFLTELSTKRNASFTPQELLGKAQLLSVPLSQYERLAASSRALFVDDIERAEYTSSTRLDRRLAIPADPRCVCFAGDGGQGKSWAMAAAAERVSREYEHFVVYVRATGDATRDFAESAEKISREVLRRSEASSLRALALDVDELLPADDRPWLTICIDDVQSAQEAEGLLVADREHDRTRVVFTAPTAVAVGLRGRENVTVVHVPDFTTPELREFLDRHGWVWGAVPSDIRRVIHRPLLARLFVEVAGDPTWRGTTEYALYEKYWARLTMGGQADYPQDAVLLRELALASAINKVGYPWSAATLRQSGVDDGVRRRLERTGWLRRETDGGASIWHDRLFNWAVAEALAGNVRTTASTVTEFADSLAELSPRFGNSRFGYVPMDALWLASGDDALSRADLTAVLQTLERAAAYGGASVLYEELIPTLGMRIVPALVARVQDIGTEERPSVRMLSTSLYRAAGVNLKDETIQSLLSHPNARVQDVALRYLATAPRTGLLDEIWRLHLQRQTLEGRDRYLGYEATYSSLAAGTRRDPSWLKKRVLTAASEMEPVWDLAYLIAGLANDAGERLWRELKDRLIALVPLSHARSLVRCIHTYRDRDEIERLVAWLPEKTDFAGAAAFAALVNLDPDRALTYINNRDLRELGFTPSWWLPWLILAEPDRSRAQIRERIAANQDHLRYAADLFTGHHDAIDPETVELFLQQLTQSIPEYIQTGDLTRPSPFDSLMRLLAKCSSLPQLRVLESHRGDAVETQLTALAMLWIGQDYGGLDRELKHLRVVLQRIGGAGYRTFARESLRRVEPDDYTSILDAAEPCVHAVIDELQGIVDRFIDADPSSRGHHLAFYALRLLAAAGDRNRVLDAAIKRTGNIEIDVPVLLAEHPPATGKKIDTLLDRISTTGGEDRVASIYALGLTGWSEAAAHLRSIARESAATDVKTAALMALQSLIEGDQPMDAAAIDIETELFPRVRALFRIGTPEALDAIERALLGIESPDNDLLDAGAALLDATRGPRVAAWMWPHLQKHHVLFWHERWWDVLQYVPQGREILLEHATGDRDEVRLHAARVLARIDPSASTRIVEQAMLDHLRGHDRLLEVLLQADPVKGSEVLRDHLLDEPDEQCRMAAGRLFRRHSEGILDLLPDMFSSLDLDVRRCACEITGWLRDHPHRLDLKSRAMTDPSMTVQQAAIAAIRRQAEFAAAHELRAELQTATGICAFTYADALAEIADPIVLSNADEPLCIWPAIKEQPALLRLHFEEKLKECAKAVQERAERKTRDRRDDVG